METKDQLIYNVKEWIKINSEIDKLKMEIKEKTNYKKSLTESLVNVMKNNDIDCFDINGGTLIYKKNKVKKTINGKMLLNVLQNYYKTNTELAEDVTKFIMDSREEQIKETIKHKINIK